MYFTPLSPGPTPLEAALALAPRGGLCWLDGGLEHGSEGRWSFVAAEPVETVRVPFGQTDPLAAFARLDRGAPAGELPLRGPLAPEEVPRWIGYVAYDAHWSGREGARHRREAPPLAVYLARPAALYAYDHQDAQGYALGDSPEDVDGLQRALQSAGTRPPPDLGFRAGPVDVRPDAAGHAAAVQRAIEHMRAGDVYQVNLARRFEAAFEGSALGLWLRMRALSPTPLACFVDGGDHQILACTMERFLRLTRSDGQLTTRPIKGTVARQGDDAGEVTALLADPKEQAEHSMVVDLMRNDLGRVAQYGSVRVDPLMRTEAFAGLHHLVSTVHAQVNEDLELDDLLRATFPPGSVTGTPKQRATEIIEALEPCARGVYCGAVGFVDRAGGCSWAVAIRTASVARGRVRYFAGGGLVVQSDPERETAETELKARVFLDAIR